MVLLWNNLILFIISQQYLSVILPKNILTVYSKNIKNESFLYLPIDIGALNLTHVYVTVNRRN
jgi:hypothetical protein